MLLHFLNKKVKAHGLELRNLAYSVRLIIDQICLSLCLNKIIPLLSDEMMEPEKKKKPDQCKDKGRQKQGQGQSGQRNGKGSSCGLTDRSVPTLHYGAPNNFDLFKKKIALACMEIHKNFLCLITDEKYYNTPTVDMSLFDLTNNPHEIEKGHLREAHKRDKEIDDICINNDHVHLQHLQVSKESLDEIQGQPPWLKLEVSKDPLQLWVMIKKSHQVLTTSKVATREEYSSC
jgi:hypothetical protein